MSTPLLTATDEVSFSFYVDASKPAQILSAGVIAGAVTVRGSGGPHAVERLRRTGWDAPVLFDRGGYERGCPSVPVQAWVDMQLAARAERVLTPGRWVGWAEAVGLSQALEAELEIARSWNATALLAVDSRWLTKGVEISSEALASADRPVAVVLGHRGDPLAAGGAVGGLIAIAKKTDHLTVLRSDHGAIGAAVFGAKHAAIGLRSGTRHLVPPGVQGGGKIADPTARLFVAQLMDWFTAATIAGWATAESPIDCKYPCCDGAPLDRFLDHRLAAAATYHNQVVLAEVASYVLNAPPNDRRRLFAQMCREAVMRHDTLGFNDVEPKAQLSAWALWY